MPTGREGRHRPWTLKHGFERGGYPVHVVMLLDVTPALVGHGWPVAAALNQVQERGREARFVPRLDEQGGPAFPDHLGNSSDPARHHGEPGSLRLQEHVPSLLHQARQKVDIGFVHPPEDLDARRRPEQLDATLGPQGPHDGRPRKP